MDALEPFDVVSFTGSAETARIIRSHPAVAERSVRCNIEADSLNTALLDPQAAADSEAFQLLVNEVTREMTVKAGQKCTAIRRVMVPRALYDAAAQAIGAKLTKVTVGNPRNESVRMGALVSRAQLAAVREGLSHLQTQAETLHDGNGHALVDADPAHACCVGPTLLGTRNAAGSDASGRIHDTEVFGPVATLLPYRDAEHALQLIARGKGSLVASLYGSDAKALADVAIELAPLHGRVHVISPDVAALHTGHGNVMPQSLHGGPGRAGGAGTLAVSVWVMVCLLRLRPDGPAWPCSPGWRHGGGRSSARASHRVPRRRRHGPGRRAAIAASRCRDRCAARQRRD